MAITEIAEGLLRDAFPLIDQLHFKKNDDGTYTVFFSKKLQNVHALMSVDIQHHLTRYMPVTSVHQVTNSIINEMRRNIKREPRWI